MRAHLPLSSLLLLVSLSVATACSSGSPDGANATTAEARPGSSSGVSPVHSVDPSKIKGLQLVNDNSESTSCAWATSYPDVPGASAMTDVMKKYVEERLATFRSTCQGDHSELNISHQFLVASGDVLGVRLTTQDSTAAANGLDRRTYWYDGKAGAYRTALALVADGSRDAFVAALKDRLKGREGTDADTLNEAFAKRSNLSSVLDDMDFTADGGLRVTFDAGAVGADAAGSYIVTLSKATVTPWLSAFGRRAQHQTLQPSRSLDLGATST
ncbi:hypothetical protein AB0I51_47945, partial [Streptomyces sp. NPDC050549]|uniref:hypothetical protein n=1 Tax=Streptomyces sp. NPDC050549 TaxID=3155406 RepID=UPI003446B2AE